MNEPNRPGPAGSAGKANFPSPAAKPGGHLPTENEAEQAAKASYAPVTPSTGGIDVGAFTQLLTAAQQSGMVPNADAITTARDREFRLGRYQRAFDVIEGLYLQLNAQAARRQGEWRRQEMQYKAGTLKLSPREWQLKQRQEMELMQKVERARRQFTRLLDGLRVLRASQPE
jgi:hypothetical protein